MSVDGAEFTTPEDCIAAMLRLHKERGYGCYTRDTGETPTRCIVCEKWKHKDERCNLFRQRGVSKKES